jgi:hypothetical protein
MDSRCSYPNCLEPTDGKRYCKSHSHWIKTNELCFDCAMNKDNCVCKRKDEIVDIATDDVTYSGAHCFDPDYTTSTSEITATHIWYTPLYPAAISEDDIIYVTQIVTDMHKLLGFPGIQDAVQNTPEASIHPVVFEGGDKNLTQRVHVDDLFEDLD